MKLSDYAALHSVTYRTAWNRFKAGKIPGAYKDNTGHIIIDIAHSVDYTKCAIYCRVSSHKQKSDLESQTERVKSWAISNGYTITSIKAEVASGVNDSRVKLTKLLNDPNWNTLIVEHKDRLTRFGFNYLEVLLKLLNKRIVVINQAEDCKRDLVNDIVSVLYSFSARMYGKRRASRATVSKALKVICDA